MVDSLIQNFCKKASRQDDKYKYMGSKYYNFCITSIKQNPESQKAKNIDEVTIVGVNNALSNMTNVKGIVEKILKERKYKSKLSEKLLQDCIKLYSTGNDGLIETLKYIKLRNYDKAIDAINKAVFVPRACEMEFNGDNKQKSPVSKENDVLFELVKIPQTFMIYK